MDQTTQLHKIIHQQNPCYTCLPADATLQRAAIALTQEKKTAVVVLENGKIEGILTRSDVLGALERDSQALVGQNTIAQLMTRDLVLCGPRISVAQAMDCMAESKIEHLPVVENGRLLSVIHERNLAASRITSLQAEIAQLREYIERLHNAVED